MVIQRWQSVLLLIAAVAIAVFVCLPVGNDVAGQVSYPRKVVECMPVFIMCCLNGVLLIIDIFLYNDLRLQKRIAAICVYMAIVELAAVLAWGFGIGQQDPVVFVWNWSVALPLVAVTATLWARARMSADEKLLRSYDRLR